VLKGISNTKLIKKSILFSFIALILFFSPYFPSPKLFGEDTVVTDLQQQINQYTQKLVELSQAKKTLKNEISYINSRIELTRLQILQTENSIQTLQTEIADLSIKIDQLDIDLNALSSIFIHQTDQNYKLQKKLPPFVSLIFGNFNEFLKQQKYLTVVQKNVRNTLVNMETVRTNYDIQKQKKAKKQQELETLQKQLATQKTDLAQQKESKSNLLAITKNDESHYQKLKQEAENELQALLSAKFVGKRQVKKGDALGTMGSTGYSTGPHLHFGLYNLREEDLNSWSYFNDINPLQYLASHAWPMNNLNLPTDINRECTKDYQMASLPESPRNQELGSITQCYGQTRYSYAMYSNHLHGGIDIVSSSKTIIAVNDGVAYFFKDPYPGQKRGFGNNVRIFHSDGKMTLYLHLLLQE